MEIAHDNSWEIAVPARARQGEALSLVFGDLPAAERADHVATLLAAARAGKISFEGLWEARREGQLVGAIWTQSQPGRTAGVWPPRLVDGEPADCAAALLNAALANLAERDVRIAQALVPTDAERAAANLLRAGFVHLADLSYLVSLRESFPTEPPPTELRFESWSPRLDARLARTIEWTYEGTLDCPRLNGVRDTADVLAGYRATGSFDASRWMLVVDGQHDVGCLLLADHPADAHWELVYTGLVPEARGRGWGLVLTRQAQWLARMANRARLVLAVDAANAPALDMYTRAGFVVWDKRCALLKVLSPPGTTNRA